jgi:hypothetical protein
MAKHTAKTTIIRGTLTCFFCGRSLFFIGFLPIDDQRVKLATISKMSGIFNESSLSCQYENSKRMINPVHADGIMSFFRQRAIPSLSFPVPL